MVVDGADELVGVGSAVGWAFGHVRTRVLSVVRTGRLVARTGHVAVHGITCRREGASHGRWSHRSLMRGELVIQTVRRAIHERSHSDCGRAEVSSAVVVHGRVVAGFVLAQDVELALETILVFCVVLNHKRVERQTERSRAKGSHLAQNDIFRNA